MSYRRDVRYDPNSRVRVDSEQIPLPIEMVYNSIVDAITNVDQQTDEISYFHNGIEHFNRIYFKYPPEWKTSDVGEKIIGVRNMKINIRKHLQIEFTLYVRKYRKNKFDELAKDLYPDVELEDLDDEQIQDVVNRMNREDIQVYKIDYFNDLFENIDDFIKDLYETIEDKNLYDKLYYDTLNSDKSKEEKLAIIEQLNKDREDYDLLCLRNDVPFYLFDKYDVSVIVDIGDETKLLFGSGIANDDKFYVDFMMTTTNNDDTYNKFYMWDEDNDKPLPYEVMNPGELDEDDRFTFDTACYFHIGDSNPYRNNIDYVTKFHRKLIFKHILTNLECEVAASFANQSNHNIIGRTNECYTPIKYYKINDNDDKFWVELYDRNEITVPVAFEDFFMFTMDVVFLQNRKLLYS